MTQSLANPAPAGKAPCARHCEANAFEITIRGLRGEIERMKSAQQESVGVVHHKPASVVGADYEQVAVFTRAVEAGTRLYDGPPTPEQQEVTVPDLTHDAWDEWQDKHSLILEREALDDLRSMLSAAQPTPCTWTQSPDPNMPDTYSATCGVVWTFSEGGPAENGMVFCPGCGSKVTKGGAS